MVTSDTSKFYKFHILCALSLLAWASVNAGEMKLVSYNIRHSAGMDGKVDLSRQLAILKNLDADLIALQEVDKLCERSGNVDQAKYFSEKLGMHFVFAKALNLGAGEYGQAVLSKYPIEKSVVHVFPSKTEARIALEAQVSVPNVGKLSYCSVHYSFSSAEERMPQVLAFEEAIKDRAHPVILTGDFNATPISKVMLHYSKNWKIVEKKGAVLTVPADVPRNEIDFCVLKNLEHKSAVIIVLDEPMASDHRPIVTKVILK